MAEQSVQIRRRVPTRTGAAMANALQWGGMIGVVLAYAFYVRKPFVAACITIAGCLSILAWALTLTPVAWGVVALEVAVIAISIRNLWLTGSAA